MGGKASWWMFEEALLTTLTVEGGLSQRRALDLIGLSRGSLHHRRHPRPRVDTPVPHTARRWAAWLAPDEVAVIAGHVKTAFQQGNSVHQAFYEALDAGTPVASLSSWHRIARTLEVDRPARSTGKRGTVVAPTWSATGPMQVWSWDITKLKGRFRRSFHDFYVVVDVYSRKITGWRVEDRESGELAQQMFTTAITDHGGQVPRIVHSDGGSAMVSKPLVALLEDLGVELSRNRPRVSNDNPYSESLFKTAKYRPDVPTFFNDLDHARSWASAFVSWYNNHHRHSALAGHTPNSVHDGSWAQIQTRRQAAMDALYNAHPERFTQPARLATPPARVALNPTK